ncbi:MAG: hypothetical protein AB8C84_09100 [Oligoflexales bacterium]
MAKYFNPMPGEKIKLDDKELLYNSNRVQPWDLKGYIHVTPPKGRCLYINTDKRREDLMICEPQNVSFTIKDLSLMGSLTWNVGMADSELDFGVPLTWESQYLIGKGVRWGLEWPGPSYPIVINNCWVENGPSRRVHIQLVNQKKWTMSFPDRDELVDQPPPPSNLYYAKSSTDGSKETSADNEVKVKEPKKGGGLNLKISRLMNKKTYKWQGFHRYTYQTGSWRFHSVASNPPGMEGACRYKIKSWKSHPDIGLIECHETDQFRWVYLPLRCLKQLEIREKISK